MNKLDFFGAGPKIGRIALPWLALSIIISLFFRGKFNYIQPGGRSLYIAGAFCVAAGLIMYFSTLPLLLKGLKETRLVTNGAFYLCCNPLYTSIILFLIPGTSLLMNSWLVLTSSIAGYVAFKMYVGDEIGEMRKFFGKDYEKYRKETPEFFPVPFRKIFR